MKTLFLDIETLPADEGSRDALAYLYERKQEKTRQKAGTKEGAVVPATADAEDFEQFLLRTSFDGAFGRILCIGYAVDDGPVDALTGDERDILVRFWELARTVSRYAGHNVDGVRSALHLPALDRLRRATEREPLVRAVPQRSDLRHDEGVGEVVEHERWA